MQKFVTFLYSLHLDVRTNIHAIKTHTNEDILR